MRPTAASSLVAGLAVAALLATACGDDDPPTTAGQDPPTGAPDDEPAIDPGDGGRYDPEISPSDFVADVDNPYMPLAPGMHWTYEGTSDGETEVIEVTVLDEHREVMGIPATVVRDTVSVDGEVAEDTYDWYAQDRDGNVWYLGEDSKEYEDGEVTSTEGSWEAGVDGALPGIVMPADPRPGQSYRQEFYPGHAEDLAEVTEVDATRSIALGDYHDVLVTREWNPLEPDVLEDKTYAPGVGLIVEEGVRGSDAAIELTAFSG